MRSLTLSARRRGSIDFLAGLTVTLSGSFSTGPAITLSTPLAMNSRNAGPLEARCDASTSSAGEPAPDLIRAAASSHA